MTSRKNVKRFKTLPEKYPKQFALAKRLSKIPGLQINIVETQGFWLWGVIVFDGITLGRLLWHKGRFSHIKWYKAGYNVKLAFQIKCMMTYNVLVKDKLFENLEISAKIEAEEKYQDKVNVRNELPIKKRKPLTFPNWQNYLKLPDECKVFGVMS